MIIIPIDWNIFLPGEPAAGNPQQIQIVSLNNAANIQIKDYILANRMWTKNFLCNWIQHIYNLVDERMNERRVHILNATVTTEFAKILEYVFIKILWKKDAPADADLQP